MMIITPNKSDILLGRGGKNNKNQGNELLRQLSRKHALKYDLSSKTKKADIIDSLLSQISASKPKVRFLLQDKTTRKWDLASKCASREKVSQALRDAARRGQNNKDRNKNSFSVEYHSGVQGLPGYYEEEDCYVIGSFKSYKGSNVHKNEQPHYFNPGMDFGKSPGRVSTNITNSFYPLQPKENLNGHYGHPPSSGSLGNSSSSSVNSYSPEQLSTHTPELTSTRAPEQTSREAPPSPYSGSTVSSHSDPHFVSQNHYYNTEITSTHAPEQTFRRAPEQTPSPYSGSTVSSHNPHFVSQEYCYSAPQVQAPNHCHENERKRTYSSSTFSGQDDRTETFRNVKRRRSCYEIEPVPFQQHVIVDPLKTNKKVDPPVLSTRDELDKLELSNFDDLDNFDWGLRVNV